MTARMQRLYWASPYPVKCWMASMYSRRWGRYRHGPAYGRILEGIAERDRWTRDRLQEYQQEELLSLLRHANTHIPYYRTEFRKLGIDITAIRGPEDLPLLPILEKQMARTRSDELVDARLERRHLIRRETSGTTGTPLTIMRTIEEESAASAFLDARWHQVAGMRRRRNRSVSIGGHLVAAPNRSHPPFWVYSGHWDQLYMSSFHLAVTNLKAYVRAIRDFGGEYIEGYPSSVYAIARYIIDDGLPPLSFRACFTTAETLFDYQREAISRAFDCRTYDQYGCTEQAVFAAECEQGSMHLSPEVGIVEVLGPDGMPLEVGQVGDLVCTSLISRTQPFIRYRLGDVGALRDGVCPCGKPLPMLSGIEGRTDDVLLTLDGRRIGRLDSVFKGAANISEAQIVQDDLGLIRIRVVPGGRYRTDDGERARTNLQARLGGKVEIRVEIVPVIERTSRGKFRAVVNNMPKNGGLS